MITVNSISGGKTSCYMAVHYPADVNIFACVCIDYPPAAPKDPAVRAYVSDKLAGNFIASAEHEKTLKVLMQLEQFIGKEIVWVRGKSFDEVVDEAGCLPTWARRFCTTELKIIPMFEYLYPRYGKTIHNIGFRADEPERIKNGVQRTLHRPVSCNNFGHCFQNWEYFDWQEKRYPLYRTFHYEIRRFWLSKPQFDFPRDSNCRGCHHKPAELIKQNWLETPEIMQWFADQEKKGKFNTWHDDLIPYEQIFKTEYLNLFSGVSDFTMCNSGGCTD
jgi:hypothetical protein